MPVLPPRRSPRALLHVVGACAALASGSVMAQARAGTCTGPTIRADDRVSARWRAAITALEEELHELSDLDRCGRVLIFGAGDEVVVEATLADGRATARRVSRPDELAATVGALLLLPPESARPAPTVVAPHVPPPISPSPEPSPPVVAPASATSQPIEVHLEGGAGLGGRISGGRFVSLGIELFAEVSLDDWLIGTRFRENFRERLVDPDDRPVHARTAALSALAGRRFHVLSGWNVDTLLGPALVVEREVLESGDEKTDKSASSQDVRLATMLRISSTSAPIRFFGALDGEISPGRLLGEGRRPDPDLPPLPLWSVGVTFGAMGGVF